MGAQEVTPLTVYDSAWTAMSRTYFDTSLINGRWRDAYDSLRAGLGQDASMDDARNAIRALIRVPGQSHFVLIPGDAIPESGRSGSNRADATPGTSGIVPRLVGDTLVIWRVLPGSGAAAVGARPGDAILAIDGLTTDTTRARLRRAFGASGRDAAMLLLQVAMSRLNGVTGDSVRVALRGLDGRLRDVTIERSRMPGKESRYGNLPLMMVDARLDTTTVSIGARDVDIPIISFSGWFPVISQDLDRFAFATRDAPGVIIDLRGNTGGAIGFIGGFAGHFSDTAWSLGTLHGRGAQIRLAANPRRATPTGERVGVITAPIAILVDAMTASSSEFFTAGMQGLGRARIFGETTAGQSLPAAMLRLPSGDILMYPVADHEDALGRRIEGRGVEPDTRTPLDRSALAAGRDAALDAARRWLADTLAKR